MDEDCNTIDREDMELPDLTESDSDEQVDSATVDTGEPQPEDDSEKDEEQ